MAKRFSIEAVFKAVDRVSAPVTKMQNRVGKMTRSIDRGLRRANKSLDKFGQSAKRAAGVAAAAMAGFGVAAMDVIRTGAGFEQTIVNAAAKFPGEIRKGTAAFDMLKKAAADVGATTEFTASQSAEALNFLAMAGFTAENAVAALPAVVDLATAAQVDLATATDIATDSLGAMGLATTDSAQLSKNLARVNDVLAKTTTTANTNMEQMFEAISEGGPVATSAGASIETFAALTGELANAGIKGGKAGTTLKNMFLSLASASGTSGAVLKRLGIRTKDANGNMRDITDILGELNGALSKFGTGEKSAILKEIFGKIPIAGVNVLLQSGSKRLKEYRGQLEGATGAAKGMAATMRDTVQGRINSLTSAVEGVKIAIFDLESGPLANLLDRMTNWVRLNKDLIATRVSEFVGDMAFGFGRLSEWLSASVPMLKAFGVYVVSVKTYAAATKLAAFWSGVFNQKVGANPLGALMLTMVALIAYIVSAIEKFGGLNAAIDSVKNAGQQVATILGVDTAEGAGNARAAAGERAAKNAQTVEGKDAERQRQAAMFLARKQTAEVTIKDETGRAAVTGGKLPGGVRLQQTGAF